MKVLIAGGVKTQNIVTGLEKKFVSGGVDFIVVPYIEDIEDIFSRGEYYDRALIIEQCWNDDLNDTDEVSIRHKINTFATQSVSRDTKGLNYVFLAQTEESAAMVYEEILALQPISVVVVKSAPYTVNFFASLLTCDIEQFPENIVYKPVLEMPEEEAQVQDIKQKTEEDKEEIQFNQEEIDDISRELFEPDEYEAPGLDDYDKGVKVEREVKETEEEQVQAGGSDNWNDLFGDNLFEGETEEVEDEEEIEAKEEEFEPSGELPDFSDGDYTEPDIEEQIEDIKPAPKEDNKDKVMIGGTKEAVFDTEETVVEDDNTDFEKSGELPEFNSSINNDKEPEAVTKQEEKLDESGELGVFDDDIYGGADDFDVEVDVDEHDEYVPQFAQEAKIEDKQNVVMEEETVPVHDISRDQKEQVYVEDKSTFDDDFYKETDTHQNNIKPRERENVGTEQIRAALEAFASRGNSIAVTGFGGSGTSTVAYHLANTIANIGYTVLLVDMDTAGRTQSYISKDNYDCVEHDGANLMQALKSSSGINAYVSIVRPGFRLLTMGLGGDIVPLDKMVQSQKLSRFINLAKTSHNFVIYDMPFNAATGCAEDVTFMADNIVLVADSSNWGTTKALLAVCNVESEDMQDTLFNRGQLLLNRCGKSSRIMGRKVKSVNDIVKAMDMKVKDILGEDPGYYFQDMHICGALEEIKELEDGWFGKNQYSDAQKGQQQFLELLINIVLRK